MTNPPPMPYHDDVEQLVEDEQDLIRETIETMRHSMEQSFEEHRHATSATHAKSHGVVTGTMSIRPDLPPELAQGLFAAPGTHEVVMRYASEPGQIDPDTARRARGVALKVLDVPGEMLNPAWTSQDFLLNTWPVIPQGDVATYLSAIKQRDKHAGHYLRTVAATTVRNPDPEGLLFDRTPNIHPVAHAYYSQGAFRYGDHVAKFALRPARELREVLGDRTVGRSAPPGVLRDWVREHFVEHGATYEFGVQLCTDLESMPVEDASVEWPEDLSPYRAVATVEFAPQETFSPARRTYAEDVMSWRPWYGLAAHRPLGSINRVRKDAYEALGQWRHDVNAVEERNPRSLDDVPA